MYVLVIGYFLLLLTAGYVAGRITKGTSEDYFLASRNVTPILMFISLAATNFSAFFFLGFAGAAYKYGFGQYGIMGVGTALMPVMFYVIGRRVWQLGKEHGFVTPSELIEKTFKSRALGLLVLFVMVVYTLPYLGVQAIGAGIILNSAVGFDVTTGACLVMLIIMAYILSGGMRGSIWTDVIQGVFMLSAMALAVYFVSAGLGGFENAGVNAFHSKPELFDRPGGMDYFTPQLWLSFMLLWMFVDPMFPHLFTRFYTAKTEKSLKTSMILYPFVVSFLFLVPVLIGVWANATDLKVASADSILPEMVRTYAPDWVYTIVMLGALAALMSTADSQLLALSTMLSRDLKLKGEVLKSRLITVGLTLFAVVFVVFGFNAKEGIFATLVNTTFSGLVVLFPTFYAALYRPNTSKWACMTSIIMGEASIFLFRTNILPTFGFLEGVLGLGVAACVMFSVDALVSSAKS
ncbi:MAG: sodium:solute symporter family protein [Candidatus Altiarchaeota archaeon]